MHSKTWCQLLVEKISAINYHESKNGFNQLVLAESQKKLIESLVSKHGEQVKDGDDIGELEDIVPGKGKSLVILLYGLKPFSLVTHGLVNAILTSSRSARRRENAHCGYDGHAPR